MFFIMGTGNKAEDCGTLDHFTCPGCGRLGDLHITKSYSYVSVFFIPLIKMNVTYLATCPHCGRTMELNPRDGKEFERTGSFHPTEESFANMSAPLEMNAPRYCGQCGRRLGPSDRFCPSCGRPIASNQPPQT